MATATTARPVCIWQWAGVGARASMALRYRLTLAWFTTLSAITSQSDRAADR